MKYYLIHFRDYYAESNGRTGRKAFLVFMAVHLFIFVVTVGLDLMLIIYAEDFLFSGALSLIYSLLSLLPFLSIMIRRLHDTGKSGWLLSLLLIPLIGMVIVLVFLLRKGNTGDNRFGSTPVNHKTKFIVK
ncbi:MAG: DUF805 domain-containing protein [Cyclobacteriaceae bacterium]